MNTEDKLREEVKETKQNNLKAAIERITRVRMKERKKERIIEGGRLEIK